MKFLFCVYFTTIKKNIWKHKRKKSPSYNNSTQGTSEQTHSELHRTLEKTIRLHWGNEEVEVERYTMFMEEKNQCCKEGTSSQINP